MSKLSENNFIIRQSNGLMKLDEYDLKLLNLLLDNSRLSVSELARLVGLSRQTVRTRLEKLEKEGVIKKYTIKISPDLERSESIVILILETEKPEKLQEYSEIIEINKITSKKYVVKVLTNRLGDISRIAEDPGLNILEIMPVLEWEEKEREFRIEVPFRCDYCGKEVVDRPVIYKYHNRVFVFCCKTCLREFKESSED